MTLVTFKDLCIDVNDMAVEAEFWARVLGLEVVPDDDAIGSVHLAGPTPHHSVWPCVVPEPKTVKNRVHLDVHAAEALVPGATQLSAVEEFGWTVLADPEGQEFCTFVRDEVPAYRLYEVVVDSVDPPRISAWWQGLMGGELDPDDLADESGAVHGLQKVPGMPFEWLVFGRVPEPKTAKNRVHWDVNLAAGVTIDDVLSAGATLLRERDDEISWTVLADPEGNEFCVFDEGVR